MVNTTNLYWSASGESLHTFARSIESLGPGLRAPGVRGEDIVIPGRPGKVWVPKDPDSRTLPLSMWVLGYADGPGASVGGQQKFYENWNNLVRLLWTPGKQFPLQKRFYDNGVLLTATAMAEFSSGLEPTMMGRKGARSLVDLSLANPYFYDDAPQTVTLVNGDNTVAVRGNAPTRRIEVTINGARKNVRIRNKSGITDHTMQFVPDLSSGSKAVIDVENYKSTTTPASGPGFESTVDVRHSGHKAWLELVPGNNVINLSSDSGIGVVTLKTWGAWI